MDCINKNIISLKLILFAGFTFFVLNSYSQKNDSAVFEKPIMEHSPKKATILSAIIPGAGQVYNKKWWKVPIVYGAIGTCFYLAVNNNTEYNKYFGELAYRSCYIGGRLNPAFTNFSDANLVEQANYHRKWRDNFFVFTGVAYLLNIVDANVDAHLFSFDVSEDLSLSIKPYSEFQNIDSELVNGIRLSLTLK